jgi:DNA-binding transcriptional LysR family regulator
MAVASRSFDLVLRMVRARELDIGLVQVVEFARVRERMERDIIYRFCGRETCSPFGLPGHPLVGKRRPTLQEATLYEWALPMDMSIKLRFESEFVQAGLPIPNQVVESPSLEFVYRMGTRLNLLSILPERLASELGRETVLPVSIPQLRLTYQIAIISLRSRARSTQLSACIDLLADTCPTTD